MTKEEASKRYQIPVKILDAYESWGLCSTVKRVMGAWQYDDQDLERLSTIMALHDMGFTADEVESYMRLLLSDTDTAIVYQNGTSEQYLGRALKDFARREDVVVATKFPVRTQA